MTNTIVNVFKEVVNFMLFKRFLQRKKKKQLNDHFRSAAVFNTTLVIKAQ